MTNEMAKQIITKYVFSDFSIKSIYKFVDESITDELNQKLYAESLLIKAFQKAVIALNTREENDK